MRPVASLVEKQSKTAGRNNNGHITTRHKGGGHKATLSSRRFSSQQGRHRCEGRGVSSMTRTARLISPCCATPTANVATSSPRRVWWLVRPSSAARRLRSSLATPADPEHSGWFHPALRRDDPRQGAQLARALGSSSCWLAKASMPRSACAPAKSAACTSSAARPSAKSVTKSTACARSARPVRTVGGYPPDRSRYRDEPG